MKKKDSSKRLRIVLLLLVMLFFIVFILFGSTGTGSDSSSKNIIVSHVSDIAAHNDAGLHWGGYCWLASLTMLIREYEPTIDYWKVQNYREASTGFYFQDVHRDWSERKKTPRRREHRVKIQEKKPPLFIVFEDDELGTEGLLLAAVNLGYKPHLRIISPDGVEDRGDRIRIIRWIRFAREMGVDTKTFDEPQWKLIKELISKGYPVEVDSAPWFNDYNVIHGFNSKGYKAIMPNPADLNRTDPWLESPGGDFTTTRIIWIDKGGEPVGDERILAILKMRAGESFVNMYALINQLEKGGSFKRFDPGRFFALRTAAWKILEQNGYNESAALYRKSAKVFQDMHFKFMPEDAGEHKEMIINGLKKAAAFEEEAYHLWNK